MCSASRCFSFVALCWASAAFLTGLAVAAEPVTTDKLLVGKAVTASNILDALTPPPAKPGEEDDDEGPVRTRSIHLRPAGKPPEATAAVVPVVPHKSAGAALLITFETNSTTLRTRSMEQLDLVATALKNDRLKDFQFEVEGHADGRGSPSANLVLSQQRAESVRDYLVGKGIAESRMKAVGKGDSSPMNTRDIAAAENRRVTIATMTP